MPHDNTHTCVGMDSRSARTLCHAGAAEVAQALHKLLDQLVRVETFYDSIGGLVGYQRQCLQMLLAHGPQGTSGQDASQAQQPEVQYHMPQGLDLASYHSRAAATQAVATGIDALPHMAEIYPLGGTLHLLMGLSNETQLGLG